MAEDLGWDEEGLRQRCSDLRATLLQARLATELELEAYAPGGRENREPGLGGWIYCYASYVGMARREETPEERTRREEAEAAVLAALRDEPEPVELVRKGPEDAPRLLHVYPKAFHTLCHLTARDRELLKLSVAAHVLTDSGLEENVTWARDLFAEISYQNRVMLWALTHEGPGLPFPDTEPRPVPPAWTEELDPGDVIRVMRAHQLVNGRRIGLIGDLLSRGQEGGRRRGPGWATLAASAASELGTSARSLLRDRTLAGWLAQLSLAADAKAEAMEAARSGGAHGR